MTKKAEFAAKLTRHSYKIIQVIGPIFVFVFDFCMCVLNGMKFRFNFHFRKLPKHLHYTAIFLNGEINCSL